MEPLSAQQLSRYTPSISPSFSSQALVHPGRLRRSTTTPAASPDTPMGRYFAARNRPHARRSFRRDSGQVPLSVLSSAQPAVGTVGGSFCSTSKVKCVPLTTLFSSHHLSPHALRNVSVHAQRYTPSTFPPPIVSYSMADVHQPGSTRQRDHFRDREVLARKSKSLQQAREATPHRLNWAFYMSGQPVQMFDKQEITPEELLTLQQLTLSQNPALYYGTGIASKSGQRSRQVEKFERQLKDAIEEISGIYRLGTGGQSDVGRYSRMSRTITPGSPILEEPGDMVTPPPSPLPPLQETFITDTKK